MRNPSGSTTGQAGGLKRKRHEKRAIPSHDKSGARTRGRLQLKRTYDPADAADGLRVLVDRLWPRGLRKDKARIDLWLKEIAPSTELRRWFGHAPARWAMFRRKYRAELRHRADLLQTIKDALREGPVTLLFAARDVEHNEAVVLKDWIERH